MRYDLSIITLPELNTTAVICVRMADNDVAEVQIADFLFQRLLLRSLGR